MNFSFDININLHTQIYSLAVSYVGESFLDINDICYNVFSNEALRKEISNLKYVTNACHHNSPLINGVKTYCMVLITISSFIFSASFQQF